ncbi:MAG: acyl carrier protein [Actinomycetales bacterium]|jgi:acyl carrier protein|nr:acyl carrier protein [Actinomycetales bacterium]
MALSASEILEGLAEIVSEETGLPVESVTPESSFADDLDIDSLSMMTIMTYAEERFEVRIPDEEATKLATVQDAVDFIVKAQEA